MDFGQLTAIDAVLGAMLAIALYTDIVRGKIYNKLTIPCIIIGPALGVLIAGREGLLISLEGAGLGAVVFIAIALFRLMGGGDSKLIWAVGSLKGPSFLIWAMLFTAVAGGVLAICFLIYKRLLRETLSDMGSRTFAKVILKAPMELMPTLRAGRLPYSIAITAGVVVALFRHS
ncbi:MAG: prepilin peptidase [Armatimonadota bacterium]|nr:prepilin peptidase [Armatimonadota bacterium]